MDDQNPSPASFSSSSTAVAKHCRRLRRHAVEEESGDPVTCTGKSCHSCTAGVIADCVAVCCCPCAVVNIFALAFVKLPWAVARKCISRRKMKSRRRMVEEKRKCGVGDRDGIPEKGRVEEGTLSEIVVSSPEIGEDELNDDFSAEEIWLELYEIGHLGFGRVSFTGIPFHNKGN